MVSSGLVRALFFRSGLREQVRGEIEREQRREREARAKLEKQLGQLQQSSAGAEKRLRQLERRYERLLEKYSEATELLRRQLDVNATHVVHSGVSGNNGGYHTNPQFLEGLPNESAS